MDVTENNAHVSEALAELLAQFLGQSQLEELLESWTAEVQILENVAFSLWDERTLEAAVGRQLDILGRVVGQDRLSTDDEQFRSLIKGRIAANRSNGRVEELLNILEIISEPSDTYELIELFPAAFTITSGQAYRDTTLASITDATFVNSDGGRIGIIPHASGYTLPRFVGVLFDLITAAKAGGVGFQFRWPPASTGVFQLSSQSGTLETSSTQGLANAGQTSGGQLSGVI